MPAGAALPSREVMVELLYNNTCALFCGGKLLMERSLHPVVRPPIALRSDLASSGHYRWLVHLSMLAVDLVLIAVGFAIAYWMRYHADWPPLLKPIVSEVSTQNYVSFWVFLPITILLMGVLLVLFEARGLYRLPFGSGLLDHAGPILSSTLTGIALLIVVVFLYRPFYYSRLIFAFAGFNMVVLLISWRALLFGIRRWCWSQGIGLARILVVGGSGLSQQIMDGISMQPASGHGHHLVGYLNDTPHSSPVQASHPYLGTIAMLKQVVESQAIHLVIFALPYWEHGHLPHLVHTCRTLGVEFRIAPDLYEISFDRVDVQHVSGVPLMGLKALSLRGSNLAIKRAIDIGLIALSAPLSLPLIALIALVIRLDSRGASFFRQTRVGKHGKHFTCYKFRTMIADAEQQKAELAALNEADGPLFKIRRDPRITRVGRILRRTSLDELPQLWNVLRGEMSLVGPRPGLPEEVEQYASWHRRRLEVTPGLTGLWQVLGRSDTSFEEMVRLDIYYAENWSIGMDVRILLRTIPTVVLGRGAY